MPVRIFNLKPNQEVYERIVLVHGCVEGDPCDSLVVYHHIQSFPAQRWPITQGYFKALVHLQPGPNDIIFEVNPGDRLTFHIQYLPLLQNPPLHFVLLLGKDSKGTFDSPDYKKKAEGNGLDVAVQKLRMAAYMMQSFTAEQMLRNNFGPRTFRLEETWQKDTLSNRDLDWRSTAKIHVLRSDRTVAEIRDPNRAQQNKNGTDTGALFGFAADAIQKNKHLFPLSDDNHDAYVAVIILDAHWNTSLKLITGHAALGGNIGNIRLAIFGSQGMWSWPKNIEEIAPCFSDQTITDIKQVANDANESGTAWECLNISMGAYMHEIGHLLGCPHHPSGIMMRGYVTWNRTFMTRDPELCTRTKKPGLALALPKDECDWHRLDIMRFRFHPCFRLPYEPNVYNASKPIFLPVDGGIYCKAPAGIYLIEIFVDDELRGSIEYLDPQHDVLLIESDVRMNLPTQYRSGGILKILVLARGVEQAEIGDFAKFVNNSKPSPGTKLIWSQKYGGGSDDKQDMSFAMIPEDTYKIVVRAGSFLDGFEFHSHRSGVVRFGGTGGDAHSIELQPGEYVTGIIARTGLWVDAAGVTLSSGRRTQTYGGSGGSLTPLEPPPGFRIVGVFGYIRGWAQSIGIIYEVLQ